MENPEQIYLNVEFIIFNNERTGLRSDYFNTVGVYLINAKLILIWITFLLPE